MSKKPELESFSSEESQEESWETKFDEDGNSLDKDIMQEITLAVGKVKITSPVFDYDETKYMTDINIDDGGCSHLIEIYDFSPNMKTQDIISVFREYLKSGFDLRWVDDTHAIGIFSSKEMANQALKSIRSNVKVRPLSEASKKTRLKAVECPELSDLNQIRPQTNALIARNLVIGALGLDRNVNKTQRDEDRKKLNEAKDKKKREKQQNRSAWDGSIKGCAMDHT